MGLRAVTLDAIDRAGDCRTELPGVDVRGVPCGVMPRAFSRPSLEDFLACSLILCIALRCNLSAATSLTDSSAIENLGPCPSCNNFGVDATLPYVISGDIPFSPGMKSGVFMKEKPFTSGSLLPDIGDSKRLPIARVSFTFMACMKLAKCPNLPSFAAWSRALSKRSPWSRACRAAKDAWSMPSSSSCCFVVKRVFLTSTFGFGGSICRKLSW
mmetsp:Transcript_6083/g.23000  ORF Transcript_6083/g.23000 Transcript_6083/m.23000 type:complete len:213 (-) Transcript_6083:1136-1774(-)